MLGIPLALAGALALGQGAPVTAPSIERALEPGTRLEQQFSTGETHSYSIALQAGQFLQLAVVQNGVDLVVMLTGPAGPPVDVNVSENGPEPGSVLASIGGTYRIEIRAKNTTGKGRYVVESEHPRAATEHDRIRIQAENALVEGVALVKKATPETRKAALGNFEAARRSWSTLGDRAWEAEALLQSAAAYEALYDYRAMLDAGAKALPLFRQLGDQHGEARALMTVGNGYYGLFDFDGALRNYETALALRRAVGDRYGEGETLWRLGWVYSRTGQPRKHVEIARETVALRRELGDRSWEGWALVDLASALANLDDIQSAVDTFREALPAFRSAGDREGEAVAMQSLGAMYATLGDGARALAACEEALPALVAVGNREAEASTYIVMSGIHTAMGDRTKGLEVLNRALSIAREIGERRLEASALSWIGSELAKAHEYEKASIHLEEAVRVAAAAANQRQEAQALVQLAAVRIEMGRGPEARGYLQRAQDVVRSMGDQPRLATALYLRGRIANQEGDLAEARAQTEAALDVLESARRGLRNPTLRATFVGSVRDVYEQYVDVLMKLHRQQPGQGFDARALEASEMGRARGLLDLLSEAGLQLREGVDSALLQSERDAQDLLSAALDRQLRLAKDASTEETQAAARSVQRLTADWDAASERVKTSSPRFAALREPAPATITDLRADVLDADTALLEYTLGERRSYLWVVTRETLTAHELPPRAVIEEAARDAHTWLADPEGSNTAAQTAKPDALARLSQIILGPAKGSLGTKRLLVVVDGALHYLPFAALPDPDNPDQPLLVRHEVVGAPSAAVVALLRRERERRRPAPRALVVLADPVFDRHDERLRRRTAAAPGTTAPTAPEQPLTRALRDAGVEGRLPRLAFTRREAEAILAFVPAGQRKGALDFDASRATVTDPSLSDFRIVHFATHGFLNTAQPELSGIVLSLLDRDGREAPGFLTTNDIFNLRLNAELVVLSGCRTALGRDMRGEGLVGLSRGFMYAGTPRVLASLWKVDDAATAELMTRVYRGVLKTGLPPAQALRAAQLDLMRWPRFRHPFYWAAFQLQGEWR